MSQSSDSSEVKMGEGRVTQKAEVWTVTALGSCLVVILFDPVSKVAGLCHAMLPEPRMGTNQKDEDYKYVEPAVETLLKRMQEMGAKRQNSVAKLVGGANLFREVKSDIGERNSAVAKSKLERERIPIVGEALGGSQGRSLEFFTDTGLVTVRIKF